MANFANGTEGMQYEEKYCDKCENLQTDGDSGFTFCSIMVAHTEYGYSAKGDARKILDLLIPMREDGLFADECSMFKTSKVFEQDTLFKVGE